MHLRALLGLCWSAERLWDWEGGRITLAVFGLTYMDVIFKASIQILLDQGLNEHLSLLLFSDPKVLVKT